MNALLQATLTWQRCSVDDVDELHAIEQRVYSHPWSRGSFLESLLGGHWAWQGRHMGQRCVYWVAMPVLDELHLLNLAVHPDWQHQGLARQAIQHLVSTAKEAGLREIWLEVRVGNLRAQHVYKSAGFEAVGRRRDYYPAGAASREDALLMKLSLGEPA